MTRHEHGVATPFAGVRWCRACNKRVYKRKQARTAAAQLTAASVNEPPVAAYECPAGNKWHIGHSAPARAGTGVRRAHAIGWGRR